MYRRINTVQLVQNKVSLKKLYKRLRRRKNQIILAVFGIALMVYCLFLPGWFKLLAIPVGMGVLWLENRSSQAYYQLLFHERDKERLAYYLQLAMPEYKAFVNPLVCDPVPDVLVTGPTGIFVITVIDAEQVSYGGKQKGDLQALAARDALQVKLASYPVEAIMFIPQTSLLKPAASKVPIVSSYFSLFNYIRNYEQRLSKSELKTIDAILASQTVAQ